MPELTEKEIGKKALIYGSIFGTLISFIMVEPCLFPIRLNDRRVKIENLDARVVSTSSRFFHRTSTEYTFSKNGSLDMTYTESQRENGTWINLSKYDDKGHKTTLKIFDNLRGPEFISLTDSNGTSIDSYVINSSIGYTALVTSLYAQGKDRVRMTHDALMLTK